MTQQFTFYNELNNALKMEGPLEKGPNPRWMKNSLLESSGNTSSSNVNRMSTSASASSKTPNKKHKSIVKTPGKTPSKSPATTPGKPKTPTGGDRFIPTRSALDFEMAHYKVVRENNDDKEDAGQKDRRQMLAENGLGIDISNTRILEYQKKAPAPPEGFQNALKVVYSQSKTPASAKAATRYIPHAPERILDAPEIIDDYYLNLVDWSSTNVLAVALGTSVYLWNAESGQIEQLLELEGNDYVCSANWIQQGNLIAVGTSVGTTQLWDVNEMKRLRVMDGHSARVGALSWNSHILTSGSRSGQIIHHDVRQREHLVSTLSHHTQEVCGLKWSLDGRLLASGGNDNVLNIWSGMPGTGTFQTQPIFSLSTHQAAVKALAWCPWQSNLLASGGGTADRKIRFWNANTGECLNTIDTHSQVCSLVWSTTYKEIVSGHGFANFQLSIWKYPSLVKVTELTGHTARVLHLALSPDGTTVLSAGADETLRLWRCFVPDKKTEKKKEKGLKMTSALRPNLR